MNPMTPKVPSQEGDPVPDVLNKPDPTSQKNYLSRDISGQKGEDKTLKGLAHPLLQQEPENPCAPEETNSPIPHGTTTLADNNQAAATKIKSILKHADSPIQLSPRNVGFPDENNLTSERFYTKEAHEKDFTELEELGMDDKKSEPVYAKEHRNMVPICVPFVKQYVSDSKLQEIVIRAIFEITDEIKKR